MRIRWFMLIFVFCLAGPLLAQQEIVDAANSDVMKMTDVGAVLARLADQDANIRQKAALRLGQLKDPRAIPSLFNALADPQPAVSQSAVDALGLIGDARAMPRMLTLLAGSEGAMHAHAADSVIALAAPKTLDDLLNTLKTATPENRRVLIRALGRVNDPRAQQAVLAALDDRDPGIRQQACWALCDFPSDAVMDRLLRMARDPEQAVRLAALRILGAQGRNPEAPREVITRATPVLIDALREPAWQLRLAAAEALQTLCDSRAVVPLLQATGDADGDVQKAAREALFALGAEACDPLLAALRDKSPVVRAEAARLLWRLNDPKHIPALIVAAEDAALPVRQAAVEGLAWMHSRDARLLPIFLAAGKDPDPRLRAAAAEGLGKLGDEKGVDIYLALLTDAELPVRLAAIRTASRFTDPRVAAALAERLGATITMGEVPSNGLDIPENPTNPEPAQLARVLRALGPAALAPVQRLLTHPRREARIAGAKLVAQLGDVKAADPLLKLLDDRDVGFWAIRMLGVLKAKTAVEPLIACYKGTDPNIDRETIVTALGAIGDPRALLVLDDARRAENVLLRAKAYTAIGILHHPLSFNLIQEGLTDQDDLVRRAALRALGEYGDKGIPVLTEAFKAEQDQSKRFEIVYALLTARNPAALPMSFDYIAGTGYAVSLLSTFGPDIIPQVLEAFQEAYVKKGDDSSVKSQLYDQLAAFGAPAVPQILDALPRYEFLLTRLRPSLFERMGNVACPGLITGLKHKDPKVRAWAASELYAVGDYRAVEPLIEAMHDPDANVRQCAAGSLGELGKAAATDTLITALGDPDGTVRRAAARGLGYGNDPRAVPPLLTLLSEPDLVLRETVVKSLTCFNDPRIVEPLCAVIRGRDNPAYYATGAFSYGQDVRGVEALITFVWSSDMWQQRMSVNALAGMADPRAREALRATLKSVDHLTRQAAQSGLALLGDKAAIDALLEQLKSTDINVCLQPARALGASNLPQGIDALLALAGTEGHTWIWAGVAGLALCRDPRAIAPCIRALNGTYHRFILGDAAKALAHYNTLQVREALLAKACTGLLAGAQLAGPLADLGEARAVPVLGQYLRQNRSLYDGDDLALVADALGALRDPRAIPDLIAGLEGGNQSSRAAAAHALKLITGQDFGGDAGKWITWWEGQRQ